LNLRPFAPKANALPDCATPRNNNKKQPAKPADLSNLQKNPNIKVIQPESNEFMAKKINHL
jgi:hypothetical protein